MDINNESQILGEPYSNKQMVFKALRTLAPRYDMKRIAVETANNLSTMDLQTLMNIFLNFEMSMTNPPPRVDRNKSVALKTKSSEFSDE